MTGDEHLIELNEAARQAGYIVTEQIDAIIERAQREAEAIRRDAERDAEDTRREAVEAAQRLLGRLQALEFPLGNLVANLRDEMEHVSRQLEAGGAVVTSSASSLPPPEERGHAGGDSEDRARDRLAQDRGVADEDPPEATVTEEEDEPPASEPSPPSRPAEEAPAPGGEGWKRWVKDDDLIGAAERSSEPADEAD